MNYKFLFCLEKLLEVFFNICYANILLNFLDLQLFQCLKNGQFIKKKPSKTIQGLSEIYVHGKYFGQLCSESPDVIRNLEAIQPWKSGVCRSVTNSAFCSIFYFLRSILEVLAISYTIIEEGVAVSRKIKENRSKC